MPAQKTPLLGECLFERKENNDRGESNTHNTLSNKGAKNTNKQPSILTSITTTIQEPSIDRVEHTFDPYRADAVRKTKASCRFERTMIFWNSSS